jgi:Bacteriocin-protection, YdeI or OmpD-Associated/Domain of unknown function (DUF1905)
MSKSVSKFRFTTSLLRPELVRKAGSWMFVLVPKNVSAKLPTRGQLAVEGTLNGVTFQETLEPDGQKGHWIKIGRKLRESAKAQVGDEVAFEITPASEELEPKVPAALRKALTSTPKAKKVWSDITPAARRDWIHWITSAKQAETSERRIASACDMLAGGKRRVCCFDRSGYYSKSFSAPKAAQD